MTVVYGRALPSKTLLRLVSDYFNLFNWNIEEERKSNYFFIIMVTIMILNKYGTKLPDFTVLFSSVGHISIPSASALPNTNVKANYVFVADEAFPLKPYLMRPFPGRELENNENRRVYNYRLSRARRTIENTFGTINKLM